MAHGPLSDICFQGFLLQWFSEQAYICVPATNNHLETFTSEIANCAVYAFPKGGFFF